MKRGTSKTSTTKWGVSDVPTDAYGFVYCITNLKDGRAYIGKKLLWFKGHKRVKGRKRRILKESDWRTYNGSSLELQTDIEKLGEKNFKFEILRFCKSKGECSYYEAKFQLEQDVLLHPEKFYNSYVGCRIHRKHVLKHETVDTN